MDYEIRGFLTAADDHTEKFLENVIEAAITNASNQLAENGCSSVFDVICIKKGTVVLSYFKARTDVPSSPEQPPASSKG